MHQVENNALIISFSEYMAALEAMRQAIDLRGSSFIRSICVELSCGPIRWQEEGF